MKILNILSNVISEQKRYKLEPETYTKLLELTDKLWSVRNKPYAKMTLIDKIQFKNAKGDDGMVRINSQRHSQALKPLRLSACRYKLRCIPKRFNSSRTVWI